MMKKIIVGISVVFLMSSFVWGQKVYEPRPSEKPSKYQK